MLTPLLLLLPPGRQLRRILTVALSAVLVLGSFAAQAQTPDRFYGLGTATQDIQAGSNALFLAGANKGDQGLVSFFTAINFSGGVNPASLAVLVTGVSTGQVLVGIDSRPKTGQLYALGYNSAATTDNAQVYTVNFGTGAVTPVGSVITINLGSATAGQIGFDFNPIVDQIRVVSTTGANYRLSPIDGSVIFAASSLAYAPGDPNAGKTPGVVTAAYSNSSVTSTSTSLYDIDKVNGSILSIQSPPDAGTLTTQATVQYGPDNLSTSLYLSLDIANSSTTGLLGQIQAPVSGLSAFNIFDLDLSTGVASNKRNVSAGAYTSGFNVFDIAFPLTPPTCNAPTNPTAGGITNTSASVSFTASASATNYTVTVTPAGGTATTQTATSSPVALTGLTPGTSYTVSIVSNCFNGVLTSSAVSTTFSTTGTTPTPCDAPTNAAASNVTSNSATVSFTASATATNYTFTLTPTGGTASTQTVSASPVTLTGLTPNTAYAVSIVSNCAGGATSGAATTSFTTAAAPNPAPTITSLSPNSATAGDPGFTLTVNGTGFISGSSVSFNGVARTTTFVSATQVTAAIPASDIATPGTYGVTVANAAPGGGTSAPATFTVNAPVVNNPAPTITSLSPAAVTAGTAAQTLTVNGTNFLASSVVNFNGAARTTTFVSATQLTIALSAADQATPGAYPVTVTNPAPGGGTSAAATFTVNAVPVPAPTLAVTQGGTSYPNNGTAYNFGNQLVGTTSAPVAFTLTNSSADPLTISSITTTGNFAVSGTAPTTVPAGGTATVSVTFTPTASGTRTGTLVINSNASNAAVYTVNLSGNGQVATPNPLIAVSQGGNAIGNGGSFSGFASTTQGSSSAPVTFTITNGSATDNLTLGTFALTGPFAFSGTAPTSVAPNSSATFSLTFTPTSIGTNSGTLSIPNNSQTNNPYVINLSGQGTAPALTDLVVDNTRNISGSYNNVTITKTGVATLVGQLNVAGTLIVQSGGALLQNCQPITGPGNFVLEASAALAICDPAGIATTGAVGAVQVSGSRFFSPAASYAYNGTVAQVTGPGLPSEVLNLAVVNLSGLTLSQPVGVKQVVRLQLGSLNTNNQAFTLLSSIDGTALVDNTGGLVIGTASVQRYIDPSRNSSVGYRHYSSPVANSTVADLAVPGVFTPVVNPAYNTVGNTATPFPNVYGYNETRVTTSGSAGSIDFDKGFFSPNSTADPLRVTRGYTVNISAQAIVDFVGTLNNGSLSTASDDLNPIGLTRGPQAQSGWHLRGNPYPAPLDWNKMISNNRLVNMEQALYVFKSSGQYTGSYASYVNGVRNNGGSNVLPVAQGFFVRTSPGLVGSIAFTNAERLTTFDNTPFQRGTADTRPQLTLALGNATARTQATMYFEQGATASFDGAFDAVALPAPNGLTLATETAAAEPLAINGLPALGNADVLLPLRVAALTAGTYTLTVDNLANLPGNYHAYLRDALTGTFTDLATANSLSLNLAANGAAGGRYAVLFTTQARVLATAPAALAQLASVYPNPAHGAATLLLPLSLRGNQATVVTVVDNVGRVMLTRTLAAGAGKTLELPVTGLAPGVYSVLARTAAGLVAKRLVVQ
ncbi:DUF4394 domain-containing protein [Hymenobacter sp. BT770]|uniref:DUF4394 domain-containing protein n=1 Tax=Hymenobacter sp. BT770 TaxID=2886942 RepID=UPI001D12889D|nr:DUF4394 domain-containing protein [Hymenobacter sp. BT770]MCC3152020.1 DUF4394 domain-containing protein [Hymenobacter sp. BT770]MDO3415297.1 DUF4394 domain-containing protein [Hymenobacter sp. BT770]